MFNVNSKLYKTDADIDDVLSGALNSKFKIALKEFSKLGIKGVFQGDLMYTDDLETQTIDGVEYITFQPNTIVYAVPVSSDLGKTMLRSKVGIVWHTTYTGKKLQDMTASFGANISRLNKISSVWMDDATYKDVAGKATFTEGETKAINAILSETGRTFQTINGTELREMIRLHDRKTATIASAPVQTNNQTHCI